MSTKPCLHLEDFKKLEDFLDSTNLFIMSALSHSLERAYTTVTDSERIDYCDFLKMTMREQFQWLLSVSSGREDELKRFILRKFYQILN
ncbi:hypothetical protein C9I92_24995 [Photobacterium ganghwense]|uniref:Uncharacterized protein n=1 Tax=Photobacterium ganghwense TaxID=320778 RepID=A0A0J1GW24_9GAMM|nr:hypothetical protein ABT57_24515 [Photobacterium ganghwense]PSU03088.1 hypothetical protein C9I92_24995 [Photobacterium ganghwense]